MSSSALMVSMGINVLPSKGLRFTIIVYRGNVRKRLVVALKATADVD